VPNPKRSVPVSFLSLPDEDSYSPFLDEAVESVPNSNRESKLSSQTGLRPTSAATPEIFEFFNDVQTPNESSGSVRSNGSANAGDQNGASRGVIGSARKCKSSNSNGPSEGDAILGSWASTSTPIGSGVIRASSTSPKPTHIDRESVGLLHLSSDLAGVPWEHSRSQANLQHMPICRPSSTPVYPTSITSLFKGGDFDLGLEGSDMNTRTDALSDLLRGAEGSSSNPGSTGSGATGSSWWNGQAAQQQQSGSTQPPSVRGRDRDYSFGSLLGLSSATSSMNLRHESDGLTSSDHRRVPFGQDDSLAEDLLADRPARGSFFDQHTGAQTTRRENLRAGLSLGGTVSAPPQFLTGLYSGDGYGGSARPLSINTYASAIGGQSSLASHHSPSPIGSMALTGSPHPAIGSRTHSPVPQQSYSSASHSPAPQLGHRQSPVPGQLAGDGAGVSGVSMVSMDDSSVEGAVLRSCREILAGAADHSLKAVELANTLRARGMSYSIVLCYYSSLTCLSCNNLLYVVGTESLARVREQWGGLLSLLEKHSTHFRVDRIPKNDKVTLISTDEDDAAIFGDAARSAGLRGLNSQGVPKATFSGALNGENGSLNQSWSNQSASAAAGASAAGATRCLHVGNVPANMSEVQLMREFEKFGQLDGLKLVSQRNGTRRFAFITFHSIEQAITARHCLSKVHPWKSAISFAHKEFTQQHGGVSSASAGGHIPMHHQQQHHHNQQQQHQQHQQMMMGQAPSYGAIPDYQGNMLYQMQNNHQMMMAQANMMSYPYMNTPFNAGLNSQQAAPFWMQQQQQQAPQHHLPVSPFANPGDSFLSPGLANTSLPTSAALGAFPAAASLLAQPQQQPQAFAQPVADLDCPVLRRLCDDTYVPTQPWPVDAARDQPYCSAVIAQLQHFDGYTTISKLRGFLRNRVAAVDNIKSVPLKAMLVAYPQYFVLVSNYVHLVNNNASNIQTPAV